MPEEVATSIAILRVPPFPELPEPIRGQTVVHLRYAYSGTDFEEAERLIAPMKAAGRILLGFVHPLLPNETDAIHMDPTDPMPVWEKGMLLADLPAEAVDVLLAAAGPQVEVPLILAELRLLGGALARQPEAPNAVPGRDAAWSMFVLGPAIPELARIVPAVGKGLLAAMEPWRSPGCMVNFLGDVDGPAEVASAYPAAVAERLLEVKSAVDPDGMFTFGHALV
jgi:hypothetical protein